MLICLWAPGGLGVLRVEHPRTAVAQETAPRRVAERLAALRSEAAALATQGKSLLTELRTLEVERQVRIEELAQIDQNLKATQQAFEDANARAAALRISLNAGQPDVDERLVRLYKIGRAGYWRLLLEVTEVQSMGRAYRMASALIRLDRERVHRHRETLESLQRERAELQGRARQLTELRTHSAAARTSLDAAVAARVALVKSIESRHDLATRLAAELDAAHLKLQSTLAQRSAEALANVAVPLRPFKGDLPWPAEGILVSRFGRQRLGRTPGIEATRNGIELSIADGHVVSAIHDGTVSQAGPVSGYGQLVVIDHGGGAMSLYGHLSSPTVNSGDRVAAGSSVGRSGRNTAGNPSLYFELRVDGKPVDPLQWLRRQP